MAKITKDDLPDLKLLLSCVLAHMNTEDLPQDTQTKLRDLGFTANTNTHDTYCSNLTEVLRHLREPHHAQEFFDKYCRVFQYIVSHDILASETCAELLLWKNNGCAGGKSFKRLEAAMTHYEEKCEQWMDKLK